MWLSLRFPDSGATPRYKLFYHLTLTESTILETGIFLVRVTKNDFWTPYKSMNSPEGGNNTFGGVFKCD
jgi:hypothetical protein